MHANGFLSAPPRRFRCAVIAAFTLTAARALAQGGPPLLTDDPDTPGPGRWEINIASELEKSRSDRRVEAPSADINFGVGHRIQLKGEVPWVMGGAAGEPLQHGLGNSVFGVKWRFLGQEGRRIAWSVYPQVGFNTDHALAEHDLVDVGRQLILPTELTVEMGRVEVNGEVGRTLIDHGPDGWIYGISTETTIHPRFELLAEIHGEKTDSAPTELMVSVGARRDLWRPLKLLAAAGMVVHGPEESRPHLRLYFGLQLNLPGRFTAGLAAGP